VCGVPPIERCAAQVCSIVARRHALADSPTVVLHTAAVVS